VRSIATINTWNRIDAATRQITGEWVEQMIRKEPLDRRRDPFVLSRGARR
jgi:hypothetical protein